MQFILPGVFTHYTANIQAQIFPPATLRTIHVLVFPDWMATWWAFVLFNSLVAGLVILFIKYRLRRAKVKHQLILERKEAEHLKETDEIKSRFFSNITHEFRTPLSLIISPLEQVLKDENLTPNLSKKLSVVERNAVHLLRLVNQLLDMSKLEAGNMKVSLFRGELNSFVDDTVQLFRQTAANRHITLKTDLENAAGQYLFDTEKWEKILFNLISNALKFTPENGVVTVKLFAEDKDHETSIFHLHVSDTGIGIPEEKILHIFRRFYQADESGTLKYEGTGLGLSLVKELVDLMGGTIEVESKPGEGSDFKVILPVKKAIGKAESEIAQPQLIPLDEPNPPVTTIDKIPGKINKDLPLVLVVEDNEELGDFIAQSLGRHYRTLNASNGVEGLEIAREASPEIIISDVMMPEMDGYTFCRKIKDDVQTDHIAVILLTAKASQQSIMEGLTAGADGYLTKPFHIDELLLRVHNILLRQDKLRLLFQAQLSNPETELEKKEGQHEFITNLYKILDEHLNDSNLRVEKLAAAMAVSHRTLNRKLSALVGLSANEVIKQYRLKKAVELLKSGTNVSEAAYSVGFETHSHFSTSFKSFYGVTPTAYLDKIAKK